MKPEEFVICSDFDDVMNELVPTWISWLNSKHETKVRYEDVVEWDLEKVFPNLSIDEICEPLHLADFWESVPPKAEAAYYINKLIDEGFPFYVVTSSFYRVVESKFDSCLFRHFPFLTKRNVIITYNKQMIKCNMMIDDAVFNLEGGDYIKVLMNTPHNQNSSMIEDFRVSSWEEIYSIVHQLMDAVK